MLQTFIALKKSIQYPRQCQEPKTGFHNLNLHSAWIHQLDD
jgi:hypothetical protein